MATEKASSFKRNMQMLVIVAGIYTCYLYYGVLQQALYTKQADGTVFTFTAFTLFIQCIGNALMAYLGLLLANKFCWEKQKAYTNPDTGASQVLPLMKILRSPELIKVAAVYVFAMFTSNESLQYVSYPAQALAKSCKMVPVMIGSIILRGRRYSTLKYLCVFIVTIGVTMYQFTGGPKKGSSSDLDDLTLVEQAPGLLLLLFSLLLDGISGPGQEHLKKFGMTNMQQMLACNIWASIFMFVVALVMGQFNPALEYLRTHPDLWMSLLKFSLSSALGQIFIFACIRTFDSLILSTITTTRKFFTIVLSVLLFPNTKKPTSLQWLCVALVFTGLSIDMFFGKTKKEYVPAKTVEPLTENSSESSVLSNSSQIQNSVTRHNVKQRT